MNSQELKKSYNLCKILLMIFIFFNIVNAESTLPFGAENWQLTTIMAVITSAVLIALMFMAAYLTNNPYMIASAKLELVQWAITALIVVLFVILCQPLLAMIIKMLEVTGYSSEYIGSGYEYFLLTSTSDFLIQTTNNNLKNLADSLDQRIQEVSEQSAMTGICNFWGVGFSMSFCGALGALQGPLTNGFNAVNIGIAELEMLKVLIVMGGNIGLLILFPAGIILRTFSMTRKTGGILIALGLAFGIILPLSVIFLRYTVDQYYDYYGGARMYHVPYFYEHDDDACDEFSTKYDKHMKVPIYRYTDEGFLLNVAEPFILESVIITLGSLFFTLTFITSMGALFGMPVDVSGLMRLLQ